jgi:hypothetical protein
MSQRFYGVSAQVLLNRLKAAADEDDARHCNGLPPKVLRAVIQWLKNHLDDDDGDEDDEGIFEPGRSEHYVDPTLREGRSSRRRAYIDEASERDDQRQVRSPDKSRRVAPVREAPSVRQSRPASEDDEIRRLLGLEDGPSDAGAYEAMVALFARFDVECPHPRNQEIMSQLGLWPSGLNSSWRGPRP